MLSLVILEKLIKLEFLALAEYWSNVVPSEVKSFVSYDADCHLVACERAFYRHFFTSCQFAINDADLCFTYTCLDSIFRPVDNLNRFVKSSFALSLLWTAKFYSSLRSSYKTNTQDAIRSHTYFDRAYCALCREISPKLRSLFCVAPNTQKFLQLAR